MLIMILVNMAFVLYKLVYTALIFSMVRDTPVIFLSFLLKFTQFFYFIFIYKLSLTLYNNEPIVLVVIYEFIFQTMSGSKCN